jgi:hypothetical protein
LIGMANEFVVYSNVAHSITAEMFEGLGIFFEHHLPALQAINPSIPSIPLLLLD